MTNPLHSGILLDRISALREDWDLSEAENEQLSHIAHRVNQRFPAQDVSKMDVRRINQDFHGKQGFKGGTLLDLLFNA